MVAAWLAAVGIVRAGAQNPAPQAVFRSGVDIVDVDVSVLDKHRAPVTGLTRADFTVFEDGRPRPILAFTEVHLPPRVMSTAPWLNERGPDVATNQMPDAGRLVVLLMDRSLTLEQMPAAQAFATAAVNQLRPGDLAAVVYTARGVPQNFTADRERLLAAIHQPFVGLPNGDDGGAGECYCGTCSLESVTRIAEAVEPVHQRRKMLLIVGPNISVQSTGPCGGALAAERERALRAVRAANVTVHAYDPSGLQTLAPSAAVVSVNQAPRPAANLRRIGNLLLLPDDTGGRLIADTWRPSDRAAELFRESDSYYVLGFSPGSSRSRSLHDIRIKVNRRDVTTQARRGYYDPTAKPRAPMSVSATVPRVLGDAISGLWPKTTVPLEMAVTSVARAGLTGATVVAVLRVPRLDERALAATSSTIDVATPTTAQVLLGAFDRNGKALATHQQTVAIPARGHPASELEYEIITRLDVGPGRYEIRAAVDDSRLPAAGSAYTDIDVPNYAGSAVALSGLWFEADRPGISVPETALAEVANVQPTARRRFGRGERVSATLRVTQGLSRALVPGYMTVAITDTEDRRVFQQESRLLTEQFGANRSMDATIDLPIDRLAPGEYLLAVDVRHGTVRARRDARFVVLP